MLRKINPKKEAYLRYYFIFIFYLLGLSSCANYYGMHSHSKKLTSQQLSRKQIFSLSTKSTFSSCGWWNTFHDNQLNQLIDIALADSPTIAIAKSRVRRAQQLTREINSSLWPSIDASGYLQRQRFAKYGLVPPPFNNKIFNIGEVGLNFNYEFDFWGKNRQLLAASVSKECAAKEDLAQANLIITTAVTTAYFQLQNNIAQWKMYSTIKNQQQRILNIINSRATSGIESAIPVTSAVNNLETATILMNQYAADVKLSKNKLAILLGKNSLTTFFEIQPFSYQHYQLKLPHLLPANLIANRPDVRASRLRVEAAAHQINVAKARFFPNINLNILFSYQAAQLNHWFEPSSQNNAITGAIDLPIFDAGLRRANLGVRFAEYDEAVNTYNKTILTALKEIADQLAILKSVNSQIQSQTHSLKAITLRYHLILSQYKNGIVDYLQVLNIKTNVLNQKISLLNLQTNRMVAEANMIKALGGHYE